MDRTQGWGGRRHLQEKINHQRKQLVRSRRRYSVPRTPLPSRAQPPHAFPPGRAARELRRLRPSHTCVLTCKVVLWSEKGELKNVVTILMTISITYFSKIESACFRSLVLLQACRTIGSFRHDPKACTSAVE